MRTEGHSVGGRVAPRRTPATATALLAAAVVLLLAGASRPGAATPAAAPRLSDDAFWRFVVAASEPNGYFPSDNFVSNETTYQTVIPELVRRLPPGRVYIGVGPEQNFSYIAALRPSLAFIVDIRRQNLIEHLMYKALFELSTDRADFVFRLFSRDRPADVRAGAPLAVVLEACLNARPDPRLYGANLHDIVSTLVDRHGFPLSDDDLQQLQYVYSMFYAAGPAIQYSFPGTGERSFSRFMPNYADLMLATDGAGVARSYLATEEAFAAIKGLEVANRIVPVVGDFAGDRALPAVARFLADRGASVSAFYTSNVEQYLFQTSAGWRLFYRNVAALPADPAAVFVRSCFQGCGGRLGDFRGAPGFGGGAIVRSTTLLEPISDLLQAVQEGKIQSYEDVIARSRSAARGWAR